MTGGGTYLVTGAGGGIGSAVCDVLAAGGHRVLGVDLAYAGPTPGSDDDDRIVRHVGDVTSAAVLTSLVDEAERSEGGLAGVCFAAGVEGALAPITEYSADTFRTVMDVNVTAVFTGLQVVLPALYARARGAVVVISSQAGLRGVANLAPYSASKFAAVGLALSAANEAAPRGVRVNVLCPGPTRTRMMDTIIAAAAGRGLPSDFAAGIPVGRLGSPHEIAEAARWLLTDCPDFVTGAVLSADGGMTSH